MTITIQGLLTETPRHGATSDGNYAVTLRAGDGGGHPFEVRIPCGSGPRAAIDAQQLAQSMRAGQPCVMSGQCVRYVADHDIARFVLSMPERVEVAGRGVL